MAAAKKIINWFNKDKQETAKETAQLVLDDHILSTVSNDETIESKNQHFKQSLAQNKAKIEEATAQSEKLASLNKTKKTTDTLKKLSTDTVAEINSLKKDNKQKAAKISEYEQAFVEARGKFTIISSTLKRTMEENITIKEQLNELQVSGDESAKSLHTFF